MSVKYIIGVDAALRNTGVTVLDNAGQHVLSFNIATKNGIPDYAAVDYIVREFFERLEKYTNEVTMKHRSVAFYIENIKFTRHGDKTHARAEAIGVIKWNLRACNFPIYGVDPGAANSFLNDRFGYAQTVENASGRKSKRSSKDVKAHTMAILHKHCGFYTDNDNIADSYVMALFGYAKRVEKRRITCAPLSQIIY